jgi:hypothetical protein
LNERSISISGTQELVMGPSHRVRFGQVDAGRLLPSEEADGFGLRGLDLVRSALRPSNLLLGGVLLAGWLVLVGWTGAGPEGWQARLCADLDLQPRACGAIQLADEAGRAQIPGTGQIPGAGRPQS